MASGSNRSAILAKLEPEILYLELATLGLRRNRRRVDIAFFVYTVLSYFMLAWVFVHEAVQFGTLDAFPLFMIFLGYPSCLYVARRIVGLYFHGRTGYCTERLNVLRSRRAAVLNGVEVVHDQ